MPKRGERPQSPRHVTLFDEDWDFLSQMYGPQGANKHISISEVVKRIVHQKVLALRAKVIEQRDDASRQQQQ